jgi:photosystem II stability/assembly factor-like uncharacterized protein
VREAINQIRFVALLSGLILSLAGFVRGDEAKPKGGPPEFAHLEFRSIGPTAGGRTCRSAGVPGDPLTYYTATAAGGVWKSSDGGINWQSIFDDQPVASIGSIAIAPSDPNVVYVGSGEANIRGNVEAGDGIYKSTDAGKTWQHVWKQEGQIGTMIVHPTNPDVAFAAVLGRAFGPNKERGVYRTTDGGKTWQQVLAKNEDTGASAVCFDPSNPRILFAGLWQTRRYPWTYTSGGPGSGLYVSKDGGDSWKQLTGHGLPKGVWGKITVAVAASDPRRVYALIEAVEGGLFRSDDGGEHWKLVNGGHYLRQRAWYFTTLTVDPTNADVVWCPTYKLLKSIDGGVTFKQIKSPHHVDHHDLWIDPRNPKRMIDSNDGGVDVSVNGGESWYAPPLPIAQFYHVAADNHVPYHVSGTMQDLGTAAGPSNSLSGAGITPCHWYAVGGGETGFTAPDPVDPDIVYAGEYGGYISRYDGRTRQARNVSVYPTNPSGHGAEDLRYRFQWTAPILVSRHDHRVVYHGGNVLFRTTDGGQTWTRISPDLTRNDKAKQKWSGGPITGDNTGAEYYDTIFALAESPREAGVLWVGSDDGLVHVTRDGGQTWTNVTDNIPDVPRWGTVDCIEPSPFDAGTAYVVVDNHRLDDTHPYLYKTTDFGKTWKSLAAGLRGDDYLHAVREDPKRRGLLYLGTEHGVAFSADDGGSWRPLKLNLPTVAVTDLVVKGDDLVVGTNGRSIWIFDDLTPIREWSRQVAAEDVHLFSAAPAIRWRYDAPVHFPGPRKGQPNPPHGAIINYVLKSKPKGPITLEVLDAKGALVRKLSSVVEPPEMAEDDPDAPHALPKPTKLSSHVGVNRVVWDLRYEGAEEIKGAKIDAGEPTEGPLVTPGTYTLRLTVGGKALTTPVDVQPDPRLLVQGEPTFWATTMHVLSPSAWSPLLVRDLRFLWLAAQGQRVQADLDARLEMALKVRDDLTQVARLVNRLRTVRGQLAERNALLKDNAKAEPLIKAAGELIVKLDALEAKLHNPRAQVTYDILAQPGGAQLYSQLGAMFEWLQESDGPPTEGMREVFAGQDQDVRKYAADLKTLFEGDLARVNDLARKLDVPGVIVPEKVDGPKKP